MKKLILISLGLLLIALGVWKYLSSQKQVATIEPPAIWVAVSKVTQKEFPQTVHAIANVTAHTVNITPEVAGYVAQVAFKDGALVNQNDILVQLADAGPKARYQSLLAEEALSESKYKRIAQLAKKGIVSTQGLEEAEADLKEKQAAVIEQQVTLNKMALRAPFAGVVAKSNVYPGDYIEIGKNIVAITDVNHLHVEYSLPERYLPYLKLGQLVKISAKSYPKQVFTAKVAYISPTINTDTRSVLVYAEVDNTNKLLVPGMFVDIKQDLGRMEKVMMIPARSLMPVLEGEQVFKVVDGKAYTENVTVGRRIKDAIEIIDGLNPNDLIITDGQLKVRNGQKVNFKEPK